MPVSSSFPDNVRQKFGPALYRQNRQNQNHIWQYGDRFVCNEKKYIYILVANVTTLMIFLGSRKDMHDGLKSGRPKPKELMRTWKTSFAFFAI